MQGLHPEGDKPDQEGRDLSRRQGGERHGENQGRRGKKKPQRQVQVGVAAAERERMDRKHNREGKNTGEEASFVI